jgi:hypothetical protein
MLVSKVLPMYQNPIIIYILIMAKWYTQKSRQNTIELGFLAVFLKEQKYKIPQTWSFIFMSIAVGDANDSEGNQP